MPAVSNVRHPAVRHPLRDLRERLRGNADFIKELIVLQAEVADLSKNLNETGWAIIELYQISSAGLDGELPQQ